MRNNKAYRQKISLFGHFGAGNFGNESTLEAMLFHVRRLMPEAEVSCICSVPHIVGANYKIPVVPISGVVVRPWPFRNPVIRLARKLIIGIPSEIYRWLRGVMNLRDTDMLIVVGTGLLNDAFGIQGWGPYSVFKWSVIARLSGCRLMFVSVGAGPLERHTGRCFIKAALSLAHFRSYRDNATLEYLKGIGCRADSDRVYPDLAFSLPTDTYKRETSMTQRRVVGLGLMIHEGMYGVEKTTGVHYAAYIEALLTFGTWLLEHDYDIRLLIGDGTDAQVVQQFRALLIARAGDAENCVIADPIASPKDLLSQLAATEFVVATRFHNVLLALLLNKPSIAISFHQKCSALMSDIGLSEYCHDIKTVTGDTLVRDFRRLEANAGELSHSLRETVARYKVVLNEQYRIVFKDVLGAQITEPPDCPHPIAAQL